MQSYGQIFRALITDRKFKLTVFAERSGIQRSDIYRAFESKDGGNVSFEILSSSAPLLGFHDAHELDEAIRMAAGLPPPLNKSLRGQIRKIEKEGNSKEFLESVSNHKKPEPGTRVRPIHGGDEIAAGQPISDSADFDPGDPHQFIPGELYPWDDSAFFVRVKGNSMYPEFREGDIVIGSPGLRDQLEGRDCACIRFTKESRFRGGRVLKRLRAIDGDTITLESLNPDHKPMTVPLSEIDSMGPCVVHIRNLWKEHGFAVEEIQRARRVKLMPAVPVEDQPQKHPDYDGPDDAPPVVSLEAQARGADIAEKARAYRDHVAASKEQTTTHRRIPKGEGRP